VGSSRVQKTNVRVVAATNIHLRQAITQGKFREDLFYRLNTVPIRIPALRERKGDINLLFRKFALDFADKYTIPAVRLNEEAQTLLSGYRWPGNIRQLKSVAEQISILESDRHITAETLAKYLPTDESINLPTLANEPSADYLSDRDIIFKILFQLRGEVDELKERIADLDGGNIQSKTKQIAPILLKSYEEVQDENTQLDENTSQDRSYSLSIHENELEMIKKALDRNNGKRKQAAKELGISERTLFRKIKEHSLK
jgi:DNA-binding NtrC family response regulator